jgi:NADP-dependent 3-hydroxy acid dehydrogenase YdfG
MSKHKNDRTLFMSRVFISGSSASLGLMAAEMLVDQGHRVVLHARNAARADDAKLDQRGQDIYR